MISSPAKQRMQQILASIGTRPQKAPKVEAADFNWQQPHFFDVAQLEKIDVLTKTIAQNCTEKFSQFFNGDFNVTITSKTQHFARDFNSENTKGFYYLTFSAENQPFGLIAVPNKTAFNWTSQLLGAGDSQQAEDKDLSQLEISLLMDITGGLLNTLSKSFDRNDLAAAKEIAHDQIPFDLQSSEEVFKISFEIKKQNSQNSSQAFFLFFSKRLQQVIDKNKQAKNNKDNAKTMLDHVQKLPVSITAKLGSAMFTFEDIMNLQAGDVLMLDQTVDEPIELIFKDKTVFRGTLARSAENYAAVITETINLAKKEI